MPARLCGLQRESAFLVVAAAAVVVLDCDLQLVTVGSILLPTTVTTAAMAEAQFVAAVLEYSVAAPTVITDCLSLVTAARSRSRAELLGAKSALASAWRRIDHCCDGDVRSWAHSGRFLWMPAHKNVAAIFSLTKCRLLRQDRCLLLRQNRCLLLRQGYALS